MVCRDLIFDDRRFRTLLPEEQRFSLNGTLAHVFAGGVSAVANVRLEASSARASLGRSSGNADALPLTRNSETVAGLIGVALNGAYRTRSWFNKPGPGLARLRDRLRQTLVRSALFRIRALASWAPCFADGP